jgi:hypothetical protein
MNLAISNNTGFEASFYLVQTACGGFAKPGNVICHGEFRNFVKKDSGFDLS